MVVYNKRDTVVLYTFIDISRVSTKGTGRFLLPRINKFKQNDLRKEHDWTKKFWKIEDPWTSLLLEQSDNKPHSRVHLQKRAA